MRYWFESLNPFLGWPRLYRYLRRQSIHRLPTHVLTTTIGRQRTRIYRGIQVLLMNILSRVLLHLQSDILQENTLP